MGDTEVKLPDGTEIWFHPKGSMVLLSDYEKLQAENKELILKQDHTVAETLRDRFGYTEEETRKILMKQFMSLNDEVDQDE